MTNPKRKNADKKMIASFRTTEDISDLIELKARLSGESKSEFLNQAILDTCFNLEAVRQQDTIADFLDVAMPYATRFLDQEDAKEFMSQLKSLQRTYAKERLRAHMRVQKHLTNISIRSYMQGYMEHVGGLDGFVINQCIKDIYDQLLRHEMVSTEEYEEHERQYQLYMEEEGKKLINERL